MARYIGLYGGGRGGQIERDAEVLRDEGIEFEIKDGEDVEVPDDKPPLPPWSAVMVFPDRENAERAAEFIIVGDLEREMGSMRLSGASKLRA